MSSGKTAPLSFSFKRKVEDVQLAQPKHSSVNIPVPKQQKIDYITSLEDNKITGSKINEEDSDGELTIPLISGGGWANKVKAIKERAEKTAEKTDNTQKTENGQSKVQSLDDKAAAEVLAESSAVNEAWENRDKVVADDIVVDSTDHGEQSTLDDYDSVPVKAFGVAMLRGMGWKPGTGIGKNHADKMAEAAEPQMRPKGLGLGADPSVYKNMKLDDKPEEVGPLIKNACIKLTGGHHKGQYGKVLSLDEERVVVELSMSEETISVPQLLCCVVTNKEYKQCSRVLNAEKYNAVAEHNAEQSNKAKHEENSTKSDHKRPWVQRDLLVRCVDKKLKDGKYYKTKIVVEEVLSSSVCTCRSTGSGSLIEGVRISELETVIPKSHTEHVMIIKGQHRGKLGRVIKRDRSRYTASVELIDEGDTVTKDYDDICQYVGHPT